MRLWLRDSPCSIEAEAERVPVGWTSGGCGGSCEVADSGETEGDSCTMARGDAPTLMEAMAEAAAQSRLRYQRLVGLLQPTDMARPGRFRVSIKCEGEVDRVEGKTNGPGEDSVNERSCSSRGWAEAGYRLRVFGDGSVI